MATFVYEGDGRSVKSIINGVTTIFVGAKYAMLRVMHRPSINTQYELLLSPY